MPSPQDTMLQEALSAIQAGNRARARDIITRLLKTGQDNPDYWIWMSAVVETHKERSFCLNQVLKLDPQNAAAKRGLAMMGAAPVDDVQVIPGRFQRRNWQKQASAADEEVKKPPVTQFVIGGMVALVVVGLVLFAVFGQFQSLAQPTRAVGRRFTLTPTEGSTPTISITQTGTIGPTPLSLILNATYTPTPLYVNTPHPAQESYRVAIRAYARGDWETVRLQMTALLKAEPQSVDALYYIGESYRAEGQYPEAIASYTKAIGIKANFAPAFLGRARAALGRNPKDVRTAQADLEKAIDHDGNYGEAYLELGLLHINNKKPQEAIDVLEPAIPLMPSTPQLYLYLAMAYMQEDNPQKAIENAEKARQLDFTLVPVYRVMAEAMQAQGDLKGSLQPLVTYTKYEEDDAQAWVWLARAQDASGMTDDALKSFDRAIKIDNRLFEALLRRGQIYLDRKDGEKSLADFQAALRLKTDSYDASIGVAKAYMLMEEPGDAYMQLERTNGLAKTDAQKAELYYWRGQSLEDLKEFVAALKTWNSLLALPKASVPAEWLKYAQERVVELTRLTPTVTLTRTPTSTQTRIPTATLKPSATPKPSRTPVPTKTPKP